MENEIQYIAEQLQLQEDKYHEKVRNLIDFSSLSEEKQERASTELKLIHLAGNSKCLYMAYSIAKSLREDNKCFSVRACAGDSFICYLLGITKVSPYDPRLAYVLPYQPFLGIEGRPKYWDLDFNIPEFYRETLVNHIKTEFEDDTEFFEGVNPSGKAIRELLIYSFKGFSETELFAKNSDNKQRIKYNIALNDYVSATALVTTFPCTLNSDMRTLVTDCVDKNVGFEILNKSLDDEYLFTNQYNRLAPTDNFWQYCLGCTVAHNTIKNSFERIMICREDIWMVLQKLDVDEQTRYDIYDRIRKGRTDEFADSWMPVFEKAGEAEFLETMKRYLYICPIAHEIENVENAIELAWYEHNNPEQFALTIKQIYAKGFGAIDTGFKEVDNMIQGMRIGTLNTFAITPEVDRTAFLINMAMNEAKYGDHNVGIVSLDLPKDTLRARMLEKLTGIEYTRIYKAEYLTSRELVKVEDAKHDPAYVNTKIDSTATISITELCTRIKAMQKRYRVGLIIIDYYQLIKEAGNVDEPIPQKLKRLALELDIAIVIIAQLNDDFNSDIPFYGLSKAGFGAGEEDSDIVVFLEKENGPEKKEGQIVANILKNRITRQFGKAMINLPVNTTNKRKEQA